MLNVGAANRADPGARRGLQRRGCRGRVSRTPRGRARGKGAVPERSKSSHAREGLESLTLRTVALAEAAALVLERLVTELLSLGVLAHVLASALNAPSLQISSRPRPLELHRCRRVSGEKLVVDSPEVLGRQLACREAICANPRFGPVLRQTLQLRLMALLRDASALPKRASRKSARRAQRC